jgi:hypothetical protein
MEERCRAQGLTFWPIVLEQQGGRSKAAEIATRAIAEALAIREGGKADTLPATREDETPKTNGAAKLGVRQRRRRIPNA